MCSIQHLLVTLIRSSGATQASLAEVAGRNPRVLASGRHDGGFYSEMWRHIQAHGLWQGEIWNRRKDGEVYAEWLTITAVKRDDGTVTHFVGTQVDITERKEAEAQILNLALHDALTGLPNRLWLLQQMPRIFDGSRATGRGSPSTVCTSRPSASRRPSMA